MIETTIKEFLEGELKIPVSVGYPEEPPASFIVIEKTSSGLENYINSATFAIQSYAASYYDTALLNDAVKEAMLGNGEDKFGIIDQCDISSCRLNSDYNFTDVINKKYRYQAVFDLYY